jgi:hypothetical protein
VKLFVRLIAGLLVVVHPMLAEAAGPPAIASLAELDTQARARGSATSRLPLANASADVFRGADSFEAPGSGRVPNYLRALAVKPGIVKPFATLIKTFVFEGHVQPALKLAMATRIAQVTRSPYAAAPSSPGCARTRSMRWLPQTAWRFAGRNCRRSTSTE